MKKENRIRQIVVIASRGLRRQKWLKAKLGSLLVKHAPKTYARLRLLARPRDITTELSKQWSTPLTLNTPSDLLPVLSDPNLLRLERPDNLDAQFISLHASPSNTALEPVLDLSQMRQSPASVCFVVTAKEIDQVSLEETVQSVLRQTDPCWELMLCASADESALLERWLDVDWRMRRCVVPSGLNAVQTLVCAAVQTTSNFVGLVSQGDIVDDDIVKLIGEKVASANDADVIYTDEATQFAGDATSQPFYKPDWSPEHQHSVNMLGRFVAIRKSLLLAVSTQIDRPGEAAEYGLNLAATAHARRIAHIDDVLYVRASSTRARVGGFFSLHSLSDARNLLETYVQEEDVQTDVVADTALGSLHVRWPVPKDMPVTLLILTGMRQRELPGRGLVTLATNFVKSILSTSSFQGYKIIVVDDGVADDDLKSLLQQHGHSIQSCPKSEPFSFAYKANFATALVRSGIVLLLNDDLEVISTDWIQALAGQAARASIGAVGCRLLYADGTLQHAGVGLGFHGSAGHMFHKASADGSEYAGFASVDRNYSAVTGAVMAYRKDVFDRVGGFDERFQTDYNDIDFCLKCARAGLRVVYTPAATLFHFHNSSMQRTHDSGPERRAFLSRWPGVVARDPFFSKNFQSQSDDLPLV